MSTMPTPRDRLIDEATIAVSNAQALSYPEEIEALREDMAVAVDALFTDANFADIIRVLGGVQTTGEYSSSTGHEYATRWSFPTNCCDADTAEYYGNWGGTDA